MDMDKLLRLVAAGESKRAISRNHGVSLGFIQRRLKGKMMTRDRADVVTRLVVHNAGFSGGSGKVAISMPRVTLIDGPARAAA